MAFQPVKGTEDYYPEDYSTREAVFERLRQTANRFGFQEVETPAIESIQLLTAKSGEEVKQQIFTLEKRSAEEVALRFDLTVPLTRLFVTKARQLPKPVKWFALDKAWRYEAPQKGRQREFFQFSVELFGSDKPEADAEIINLLLDCLTTLGLTPDDFTIKLNNRKLLEGILRGIVDEQKLDAMIALVDKSAKLSEQAFDEALSEEGLTGEQASRIKEIVSLKGDAKKILEELDKRKLTGLAADGLNEIKATIAFVPENYITIDLSIARGLAYYTGNVYEVSDKNGKYRALAGGGRYDNLVQLFGGEKTPATGAAIGWSTLRLLLEEKGMLPKPAIGPEYVIAPVSEAVIPQAMGITAALRKKTSAEIDLMRRKLAKQLDYANAIKARKVIFVGPEELRARKVRVKDLESGKETLMRIEDLSAP